MSSRSDAGEMSTSYTPHISVRLREEEKTERVREGKREEMVWETDDVQGEMETRK